MSILAASHPHGYGALWRSRRLCRRQLLVHKDDLEHTKAFRVDRPIDDREVLEMQRATLPPGGALRRASTPSTTPKRNCCSPEMRSRLTLMSTRCPALSCHKGYHYQRLPLTRDELLHYQQVFPTFNFEHMPTH